MEEILDFDEWIKKSTDIKHIYYAVYDIESGSIHTISPDGVCSIGQSKIEISSELAESIFSGQTNPNTLKINHESKSIDIIEDDTAANINFTLHRVPEKNHFKGKDIDIFISYDRNKEELMFELTNKFGGTYRNDQAVDIVDKSPFWDEDMTVDYIIGNYNDPNILNETMTVRLWDMIGKKIVFKNVILPKKFSIYYAKRILRNQVFQEL